MTRILAAINRFLELFCGTLLAGMSIIVFGNVVARYVFQRAFAWSEEIALFAFVWLVFLGAVLALLRSRHLGLDILINALPVGARRYVLLLANLVTAVTLWFVVYGGYKYYLTTVPWPAPATHIPYGYINAVLPFSALLMIIILVKQTLDLFAHK
jgi:TRAP-type C4-dicarboxylate transport system permease small subunit